MLRVSYHGAGGNGIRRQAQQGNRVLISADNQVGIGRADARGSRREFSVHPLFCSYFLSFSPLAGVLYSARRALHPFLYKLGRKATAGISTGVEDMLKRRRRTWKGGNVSKMIPTPTRRDCPDTLRMTGGKSRVPCAAGRSDGGCYRWRVQRRMPAQTFRTGIIPFSTIQTQECPSPSSSSLIQL